MNTQVSKKAKNDFDPGVGERRRGPGVVRHHHGNPGRGGADQSSRGHQPVHPARCEAGC